jgi:hypothetical protein
MKKKLYCDIDSTVNNHHERIKRWTLPPWPGKEVHPNAFTPEEVLMDSPVFGSNDALKKLSRKYEIHWLTARPKNLESATFEWLKKYGYPIDSITLVDNMDKKVDFLKDREVDLFIDDFSTDHEKANTRLRYDVIKKLKKYNVNYEVFNPVSNNWGRLVKKNCGESK